MARRDRISHSTQKVVTGIHIDLDNSEATHLSYALNVAFKEVRELNRWNWLKELIEELDTMRGVGCTMGPRAKEAE